MLSLLFLGISYSTCLFLVNFIWGSLGVSGDLWQGYAFLKIIVYIMLMTHATITCMSLSFHRAHTHRGVEFNKVLDFFMQTWLWLVTGMSKLDWVSIHLYHHAHSDAQKDPHSPVQKGFFHVFFLGVFDYVKAKDNPAVQRILSRLPANAVEKFYHNNPLLGIIVLTVFNLIVFGPLYGSILSIINFSISPLFAVGGVNAIAHKWGYRNHQSGDNSRNIGFLYILNWMICGELDHNNHHAQQKSCSFRHRWFEFDIGYVYITLLSWVGLAKVKSVYNPKRLKENMKKQLLEFIDTERVSKRLEEIAREINASYEELKQQLVDRVNGEKRKLEPALESVVRELQFMLQDARRFQLN